MSLLSSNPSRGELRQLGADLKKCATDRNWMPPIESIRQVYDSLQLVFQAGSTRDRLAAAKTILSFQQAFDSRQPATASNADWQPGIDLVKQSYESLGIILQTGSTRDSIAASKLLVEYRRTFEHRLEGTE